VQIFILNAPFEFLLREKKQNYRISKRKIISRTIKAVVGKDSGKGGRER